MSLIVRIDWKFVVALGAAVIGSILAVKMEAPAAERVSIRAIDACKEVAIARSNCYLQYMSSGRMIFGLCVFFIL